MESLARRGGRLRAVHAAVLVGVVDEYAGLLPAGVDGGNLDRLVVDDVGRVGDQHGLPFHRLEVVHDDGALLGLPLAILHDVGVLVHQIASGAVVDGRNARPSFGVRSPLDRQDVALAGAGVALENLVIGPGDLGKFG